MSECEDRNQDYTSSQNPTDMSEGGDRNQDDTSSQNPTDMSSTALENDSSLLEDIQVIVKGNEDLCTLISDVLRQRFSKSCEENEAATSMNQVLVVDNRNKSRAGIPHEDLALCHEGALENNASNLNRVNISNVELSPLSNSDGNVKENVTLRPYEGSADDEDSVTSDSSSASNWLAVESDEDSKYPSTLDDDDGRSHTEESSGSEFGRGGSYDSFRFSFARQEHSSSAISSEESSDSGSRCEEESPRITTNRDGTSSEGSSKSDCSSSGGSSVDVENANLAVRVRIVYDVQDDSEESSELETSSESTDVSHLNSESVSDSESDYFNHYKSYAVSGSDYSTSESLDGSDCAKNYRYNPKSREFVSESESSSATETADEMWMENDEDSSQIYSDIGTPLCMKTGKDKIIIFERNKIDKKMLDLIKSFDSIQSCSKGFTEAPTSVNVSEKDESPLKPYDKQMFKYRATKDRVLAQCESEADDVSSTCDFSLTAESGLNPSRRDLPSTSSSNDDIESGSGSSPSYTRYPSVSEEFSPIIHLPGNSVKLQSNVSNTYRKF